ncbi:hypothetical protein EV646_111270 [Kribbella antiqua]|uniref:Uncharacterized protein n=1 Tax=Kribbella antiqua TaxID=2512217 RepID=A0A4R2IHW4_9ACTN|nr:hypothetical protein [Kribbella antiqua]TCO44077.1 hypothetical protein EV646_111270 [Kribbella antiqua]
MKTFAKFTFWMLATIGVQLVLCFGLAVGLGETSPAHSESNSLERRLYSAVDVSAFYLALSLAAVVASGVVYLVALRRRTQVVSSVALGVAWPAVPLVLFILSLNAQLLYLAVLQSLGGVVMTRIGNASEAFWVESENSLSKR